MKKLLFICALFLFAFTESNSLKKDFIEIKFNSKTIYIGKYEVSNGEYYNFLNEIKYNGAQLTKARVYSENWNSVLESSKTFEDFYFGDKNYFNYPVVNISHEGAILYCNWLSDKMSIQLGKKINARLPSKEEWLYAAKAGNHEAIYGWGGTELSNKVGDLYGNFKKDSNENNTTTMPVDSYNPNKWGLYNCSGNVAEMIDKNNVSLGGSWSTPKEDIKLTKSMLHYDNANSYTGFRVVLEIEN